LAAAEAAGQQVKRFLIPVSSRYASIIVQFAIVVVLTRALPIADTGVYFAVAGVVLASYFAAGLGIPDGLVPTVSARAAIEGQPAVTGLASFGLLVSLAIATPLAGVVGILVGLATSSPVIGGLATAWWLGYATVFCASQAVVAGGRGALGAFLFYSAPNFGMLAVVTPCVVIAGQGLTVELAVGAASAGVAIAAGVALFMSLRLGGRPRAQWASLKSAWLAGLPIALGRVVQACLIWSPVWVAALILGPREAAIIGLASRLVSAVAALVAAIRFSIRADLARDAALGKWDVIQSRSSGIALVAVTLAAFAAIAVATVGQPLIPALFGIAYGNVALVAAIMLIGTLGESLGGPVDEVLKMSGQARIVLIAQIVALVLGSAAQVGLALMAGPKLVALAYAASFVGLYVALIVILHRSRGILILPSSRGRLKRVGPLIRYARHLPPQMVIGRIAHGFLRRWRLDRAYVRSPDTVVFGNALARAFADVYEVRGERFAPEASSMYDGVFSVNGYSRSFGSAVNARWGVAHKDDPSKSRWEHDLAFFSYAIPLIKSDPGLGGHLIAELLGAMDLQVAEDGGVRGFHWSPIAVALRILALASAVELAGHEHLDPADRSVIASHLSRAVAVLRVSSEMYLGYNHAVFGETGAYVAALLVGDVRWARRSLRNAARVLARCTLPDGLWAERSPTYHVHMLLLARCLSAAAPSMDTREQFDEIVGRMERALPAIVHPDGEIAVFNDAAIADAVKPELVGWSPPPQPCHSLPDAGYFRASAGVLTVIMDAGPMGPDSVIGHGHADFLSLEVSIGKERFIVDPGVASIQGGAARRQTRSSLAHNGPAIEDLEPAEFFGSWRVGRRGRARFIALPSPGVQRPELRAVGECDGYERWGITTRREIRVSEAELLVVDTWESGTPVTGTRRSRFLVPIEWKVSAYGNDQVRFVSPLATPAIVSVRQGTLELLGDTEYFPEGPIRPRIASIVQVRPLDTDSVSILRVAI
jgi:uncharacterized heparinase superfamily protein/O-antigen/teichoic acid export membrane protein